VSADGLSVGRAAATTRTQLRLPDRLPSAEWVRIGQQICLIADASCWWLGDWLVYGQDKFPDRYRRAMVGTALDYQTLRNYAWVARRFAPSRRRDSLSFQHHAAVAALAEPDQDLWLVRAAAFGWSLRQLRTHLQQARQDCAGPQLPPGVVLTIQVPGDRRQRWEAAAQRRELELLPWAVAVIDQAADQALTTEPLPALDRGN
jgi:hypothetical protein